MSPLILVNPWPPSLKAGPQEEAGHTAHPASVICANPRPPGEAEHSWRVGELVDA